jgi:hypothetical protein
MEIVTKEYSIENRTTYDQNGTEKTSVSGGVTPCNLVHNYKRVRRNLLIGDSSLTLKMEAVYSSEMLMPLDKTTLFHIQEYCHLHTHLNENLRSQKCEEYYRYTNLIDSGPVSKRRLIS